MYHNSSALHSRDGWIILDYFAVATEVGILGSYWTRAWAKAEVASANDFADHDQHF